MKLGFIGIGNQATAMLKGIVRTKALFVTDIYAYDVDAERLRNSAETFGLQPCADAAGVSSVCDAVLFAVKPHQIEAVLAQIAAAVQASKPLVISMAAGVSLERLAAGLPEGAAIVRIMPNQNAAIAQSMTAYCHNGAPTAEQIQMTETICRAFGEVLPLDEAYFSAFFVLAGAGPAFAFLFIDQLARAGVKIGMSRQLAQKTAAQTVLGSAQLILESGAHPQELIDRVCSPGGITIEGLAALQENGFEHAVNQAVERAFEKEKKL